MASSVPHEFENCYKFLTKVKKLNLDLSLAQLKSIISSFESDKFYHLPEWIELDILSNKLEKLLEFFSQSPQLTKDIQGNFNEISKKANNNKIENHKISEKWYLVTVQRKKRKFFLEFLKNEIVKNQLYDLIPEYKTPKNSVLEDMVLIRLSDVKVASSHIKNNPYYQRIELKPLKPEEIRHILEEK